MKNHRLTLAYALTGLFVVMIVAIVGGALFMKATAVNATRESEQKWCAMVVTLDNAYQESPPQNPTGKKVAAEIARLRHDFRCKD